MQASEEEAEDEGESIDSNVLSRELLRKLPSDFTLSTNRIETCMQHFQDVITVQKSKKFEKEKNEIEWKTDSGRR